MNNEFLYMYFLSIFLTLQVTFQYVFKNQEHHVQGGTATGYVK